MLHRLLLCEQPSALRLDRGDLHQPLHATSLVCDRFPGGDRGGNSIPVMGENLHSLWDGLLGRDLSMSSIAATVEELKESPVDWKIDMKPNIEGWIRESDQLARGFAYSPAILEAVEASRELKAIRLPEEYLKEAGKRARVRVIAAGLRLAAALSSKDAGR